PDEYLTAQLFKQVDVTPDLVFVNCCHLAGVAMGLESSAIEFTRQNLNRLGASLARELIDSGVRSVVVAGWAVDDLAADAFAQRFYEEMLAGATFGRAVHGARKAAFAAAEDHSTWGAYQCYGDGGYRLPREGGRAPDSSRTEAPITVAEARRRIESLVNGLESVGTDADLDQAKADLDDIDSTAETRGWITSDDGRLCEDLATGWAAVGEFTKAIARLDDALRSGGGRATLRSLEQRANLTGRHAAKLLRDETSSDSDRTDARRFMQEALDSLELLEQISESGERSALRAGHYKRLAAAATDEDERDALLRKAVNFYRRAYEKDQADAAEKARRAEERRAAESEGDTDASAVQKEPPPDYSMLNFVQLEEIRAGRRRDESEAAAFRDHVEGLVGTEAKSATGDYWRAVSWADSLLTLAIMENDLPGRRDELVGRYETVFDSGSTSKERESSLDHLLDLAGLFGADHQDQATAIRSIHDELTVGPE
ncbi:MAG: CHAT domain-containing protein, partial [Actinomycetota bacterium]